MLYLLAAPSTLEPELSRAPAFLFCCSQTSSLPSLHFLHLLHPWNEVLISPSLRFLLSPEVLVFPSFPYAIKRISLLV